MSIQIPQEKLERIDQLIISFKQNLIKEGTHAFEQIIARHENLDIYFLAIFYHRGSYSYVFPSFASEAGLEKVTREYSIHSSIPFEEQKTSLRWNLADSPHHDRSEESFSMNETDKVILELTNLTDWILYDLLAIHPDSYSEISDLSLEYTIKTHKQIHQALIEAVNEIAKTPVIDAFINKTKCIIGIAAGDEDYDQMLENVCQTNPPENLTRIKKDIGNIDAGEQHILLYDQQTQELDSNPPKTSLTIDDFVDVIKNFKPKFEERDGAIFLKRDADNIYSDVSQGENYYNRIEAFELLKDSPHYEEMYRLFGHFTGKNFEKDDLLPQFLRAIRDKICRALSRTFPQKSFYIYMIVDRTCLHYISFFQNRHDGFFPEMKLTNNKIMFEGVREMVLLGNSSPSLKLPCILFKDKGLFYIQVYGIYFKIIFTELTVHEKSIITASEYSYEDAIEKAKTAMTEQINIASERGELTSFDVIDYPFEFVRKDDELILTEENTEDWSFAEKLIEIEIFPEFLKMYL